MEIIALIVGGLAVLLFILSFFLKDRSKLTEQELEDLSMNLYQEIYQLKKRIKVLEEEMMVDEKWGTAKQAKRPAAKPVNQIILNQVLELHKQGLPIEQIARQSSLSKEEVTSIITSRT